jgi:hypothetical protein
MYDRHFGYLIKLIPQNIKTLISPHTTSQPSCPEHPPFWVITKYFITLPKPLQITTPKCVKIKRILFVFLLGPIFCQYFNLENLIFDLAQIRQISEIK